MKCNGFWWIQRIAEKQHKNFIFWFYRLHLEHVSNIHQLINLFQQKMYKCGNSKKCIIKCDWRPRFGDLMGGGSANFYGFWWDKTSKPTSMLGNTLITFWGRFWSALHFFLIKMGPLNSALKQNTDCQNSWFIISSCW